MGAQRSDPDLADRRFVLDTSRYAAVIFDITIGLLGKVHEQAPGQVIG